MVRVRFFASLRELTGQSEMDVSLKAGANVAELFGKLEARFPQIAHYQPILLVAVNEEYSGWEKHLADGDEVAFFPPVSGGRPEDMVEITEDPIDPQALVRKVASPGAGAVVTFDGTVRDHARGKRVTHLYYEAYPAMALKEMERIRRDVLVRWPGCRVAMVHRLGRMEIGESSVFIAVSSAHRAQAFEACRHVIDTLKTSVPIWKKEHYEDGETWIEGYPAQDGRSADGQ